MQIQLYTNLGIIHPEKLAYLVEIGMNDPLIAKQLKEYILDPKVAELMQATNATPKAYHEAYRKILSILKPVTDILFSRRGQIAINEIR